MYDISMITGDGIGPELAESASAVIKTLDEKLGVKIALTKLAAGDAALKDTGYALPKETLDAIKNSDACLKAPVGESAADVIVVLRRKLDLYANLRPAKSHPGTVALRDDIDLLVVRENTEDLYSGHEVDLGDSAVALRIISKKASLRIAKNAFEAAVRRSKDAPLVTCVHKSNVMTITDGIFRDACSQVAKDYPSVRLEQMYVDACAMNLIRKPHEFDVIVTTNMFGDILSDESSQIVGGLGMAPAANVGDDFAARRRFAIQASLRRSTTMTSAALSPTGAFRHASEFFIASRVSFGKAYPVSFTGCCITCGKLCECNFYSKLFI